MKKILFALSFVALLISRTSAATYYWDTDGSSTGNDASFGTNLGGSGNWDGTANWWDGVPSSALVGWADGNDAVFHGTVGTVTIPISQTRSATGLTFKAGSGIPPSGYDISAGGTVTADRGKITLTGPAALVADPGVQGNITALVAGTVGYNVSGGGTIKFGLPTLNLNLNSSTGPVTITGGSTLDLNLSGDIGGTDVGAGNITIDNGTLRTSTAANVTFMTTARSIIVGAGGATLDTPVAAELYGGIIGGTGVLTKTGVGELRLSGGPVQVNTFSKLVLGGGTAALFTIGQATTLGDDRNLGAVPASFMQDNITIDAAVFRFNGAGGVFGDNINLHQNRGVTIGPGGATFNTLGANGFIPGKITGTGGLTKVGATTLTLSNAAGNDYAGATNINAGILRVNNTSGSGTGTNTVFVNSGGTLGGTGRVTGLVTLSSGRIQAGAGGANAQLRLPALTVDPGSTIEATLGAGGSSDVLNVENSGGLVLNGGTLTILPIANPAGSTYTLIDYAGAMGGTGLSAMTINDLTGYTTNTVSDDGDKIKIAVGSTVINRTWGVDGGGNWSAPDGANWTTGSQANGVGSVANFGLAGANTPATRIVQMTDFSKYAGTVNLTNGGVAGLSYDIQAGAGTTNRLFMNTYSGNAAINVTSGSHKISAGLTLNSPTTIDVSGTQLNIVTANNLAGLTKTGSGILLVSGVVAGSQTVGININQGKVLMESNAGGLPDNQTINIAALAQLDMGGPAGTVGINDTIGDLAGDGDIINLNGTGATPGLFLAGFQSTTYNGVINGTIAATSRFTLNKQAGSLTLTKGQNYAGITTINTGTLYANNATGSATGTNTVSVNNASLNGVFPGGVLAGNGTIAGAVTVTFTNGVATGGAIAPGATANTIGTLTLQNNLTLNSRSQLNFDLNTVSGSDVSDLISVAGVVDLGAAITNPINARKVNLNNLGSMTTGLYTLIDYGTLTGTFANLVLGTTPSGFTYSLINETTNGLIQVQVNPAAVAGDYNGNGVVDGADYVVWRKNKGLTGSPTAAQGNGDGDNDVDDADYAFWRARFGNTMGSGSGLGGGAAVPEPTAIALVLLGFGCFGSAVRRRQG